MQCSASCSVNALEDIHVSRCCSNSNPLLDTAKQESAKLKTANTRGAR